MTISIVPPPKPEDLDAKAEREFAKLTLLVDSEIAEAIDLFIQAGLSYDEIRTRIDLFLRDIPQLHALAMAKLQPQHKGGTSSEVSQASTLSVSKQGK